MRIFPVLDPILIVIIVPVLLLHELVLSVLVTSGSAIAGGQNIPVKSDPSLFLSIVLSGKSTLIGFPLNFSPSISVAKGSNPYLFSWIFPLLSTPFCNDFLSILFRVLSKNH